MSSETLAKRPPQGLFVCGTGTEVGKTYVSCAIARNLVAQGLSVAAYKPVASGAHREHGQLVSTDAVSLLRAAECGNLSAVCPQVFSAPLAPPVAARLESRVVDDQLLRSGLEYWTDRCDFVVVEGVGGLLSPVSEDDFTVTLAREFGYPIVLVATDQLGVINQVLSAISVCAEYAPNVPVAGIVLNQLEPDSDMSCASNAERIQQYCPVPLLGKIAWKSPAPLDSINWQSLADGH